MKNPFPNSTPPGTNPVAIFVVEYVPDEESPLTMRINYGRSSITNPKSIKPYKCNATLDRFVEHCDFIIDEERKEVVITVTPGDPVFMISVSNLQPFTPGEESETEISTIIPYWQLVIVFGTVFITVWVAIMIRRRETLSEKGASVE